MIKHSCGPTLGQNHTCARVRFWEYIWHFPAEGVCRVPYKTPSPSITCRYFLQEDLESVLRPASRWSNHRNASPGSASADGCSLQRSTSHYELTCVAFSCRHYFPSYNRNWRGGDGIIFSICTMMTQLVCQRKMERSADDKKVTAKKISPARVVLYIPHCFQVYYITKQSSSGQHNCYSYLTVHIWKRPNGLEYCTFIASVHLLSLFVSPAPPNNFLNQLTGFHERMLKSNATKGWCELD